MYQKVSEKLSREVPLDQPRDHLSMYLGHLKQRNTAQDSSRPSSAHTLQDRGPQRSGRLCSWHLRPFSDCRAGGHQRAQSPPVARASCAARQLRRGVRGARTVPPSRRALPWMSGAGVRLPGEQSTSRPGSECSARRVHLCPRRTGATSAKPGQGLCQRVAPAPRIPHAPWQPWHSFPLGLGSPGPHALRCPNEGTLVACAPHRTRHPGGARNGTRASSGGKHWCGPADGTARRGPVTPAAQAHATPRALRAAGKPGQARAGTQHPAGRTAGPPPPPLMWPISASPSASPSGLERVACLLRNAHVWERVPRNKSEAPGGDKTRMQEGLREFGFTGCLLKSPSEDRPAMGPSHIVLLPSPEARPQRYTKGTARASTHTDPGAPGGDARPPAL